MEKDNSDGSSISKPNKAFKKLLAKSGIAISSATIDDEYYPLDAGKMGICLIFNHKTFRCGAPERKGTDIDKDDLENFFQKCEFDVRVHTNKDKEEISEILKDAQRLFQEDTDFCCFVCCVLTHGDLCEQRTEVLYANDKVYPIEDLFSPFLEGPSLVGKPKMFFIQACRGGQTSEGVDIMFKYSAGLKLEPEVKKIGDRKFFMCTIPKEADFLIAYSTVPGSLSWKDLNKGSWFIQELCETLNEKANDLDLESILTIVRRKVAIYYESNVSDPKYHQKKQIPSLYTTLTRKFKFPCTE